MAKPRVSLEAQLAGLDPETEPTTGNVVALPGPAAKPTNEKASVYMPRSALKRIKQMALDQDKRVNDLLQEGVEMMLAKYGQPSLKDFEAK